MEHFSDTYKKIKEKLLTKQNSKEILEIFGSTFYQGNLFIPPKVLKCIRKKSHQNQEAFFLLGELRPPIL